ncbi:Crp/Fnr family transcriptional regulator [Nostoc sp. NIES-2111]
MPQRSLGPLTFKIHEQCEVLRGAMVGAMLADSPKSKLRGFRTAELIWNPTAKPDRVFQLRSGRVNIVTSDTRGNEVLLQAVKPGEIFGEICLCSHADGPHGTSAVALSPVEILEASYHEFRAQLRTDAEFMSSTLHLFCTRLAEADQRVRILAEHDARQRLRKLLAYVATLRGTPARRGSTQVSVTITHAELASLGALSRPHLSLLMTKFREEGLVSYARGSALRINLAKINGQT